MRSSCSAMLVPHVWRRFSCASRVSTRPPRFYGSRAGKASQGTGWVLVAEYGAALRGRLVQRRTARASGVPRSTSLAFSHHRSLFSQVDGTKPLTHRFLGTVDTEAGVFVAALILLLTCHLSSISIISNYYQVIHKLYHQGYSISSDN